MTNDLVIAYIGLGSNLGDRQFHLGKAVDEINQIPDTQVLRCSSWYENPAVGIRDGYDFLNGVVEVETRLPASELLQHLQAIEIQHGRIHNPERTGYENRTLDLDILLYGNAVIKNESLTVPHPRIMEREFVLIPLHELGVILE